VLGRLSEQKIFTASEMKLLLALASQASIALETIRLHLEEVSKQRLEKELDISRQIQLSLLPKSPPTITGWEFAALYQAAHQVGGDLYDFLRLPNRPEELGFVIADVAGKGIPAALFMAFCRTIIRIEAMGGGMPEQVIKRTNQLILQNSRSDIFLTAFYALLNVQNGELAFANGGHNPPIWYQAAKGKCQKLISKSALLGLFSNISTEEHKIQISPGDLLVFYTDGITEARDGNREFYGEERLISTILANKEANAQIMLQSILDNTNEFIGNSPQSDDFTLFVIKRKKELA
jgi:sigma-B regulation protein RsbU (phosphoserine phosphatase)